MTDTILQGEGNFHNLQHCEILWILFISTRKFHIIIIIIMILDPSTGAIGLNPSKFLDRESIPDYHLIIEAIDNGATRRTGNATVVIVLQVTINMCSCRHTQLSSSMTPCLYLPCFLFPYCLLLSSLSLPFFSLSLSLPLFSPSLSLSQDVDDNDPTFPQATYMVNITEDTASGSFVTMVTARDPDFGNNGLVRYQFEPINNDNFAIDEGSGSITTKRMFDFETNQRSYSLYVS